MGNMLGFSQDISTEAAAYLALENNATTLGVLYREDSSEDREQVHGSAL